MKKQFIAPRITQVVNEELMAGVCNEQFVYTSKGGANPQKRSQFGLQAATRLHEAGIASNRGSACR